MYKTDSVDEMALIFTNLFILPDAFEAIKKSSLDVRPRIFGVYKNPKRIAPFPDIEKVEVVVTTKEGTKHAVPLMPEKGKAMEENIYSIARQDIQKAVLKRFDQFMETGHFDNQLEAE